MTRSNTSVRCVYAVIVATTVGCGSPAGSSATSSAAPPITQSSPPWAKLAVIDSSSAQPPADVLGRFQSAFTRLESHCRDAPERIGDFIIAGHQQLTDRDKGTSVLELTQSVATMLDTATQNGGVPKMTSCAEPVALMVTALLGR